ncbi:uncharacterized protein LOC112501755 [Cynara cardunculus var. scolymus]|uniref:DUF7906 domain-containing protein n=1 Tax=Cynara cardunculus var. scolymus TaxID=59895 RepID=A0A103YHG2_CYNCS|nr:uncharacterized protein LOC112501755 [Cynara cardunculus var. scolymus]KVI09145.1 hypothetical protein Ccrd_012493 [Cynara cardunculus var. scolymus]
MTTTTTAVSVVITTVFLLLTTSTTSIPIIGLDSFLSQQSRLDPQATNDTFLLLSSPLKKSLSSNLRPPPTTSALLSLQISVPIYVKLVGPSSSFPSTSPSLLFSFLSAAVSSDHFHVITPFLTNTNHRLALTHSPSLDVSLSSSSLSVKLSDKIKSEIATSPSPLRSNLISISHDSIDSIIKQDFEREKPLQGVYIYLLNLGTQSKPYAYKYTDTGDSSLGVTKCSGSIWTGKGRYLWMDLSAGPVDYGPALSGDGVLPRGEFHPLTALHGRPKSQKALLADMASLIWSAYKVLLVPSLRIPVPFENSLIVQFIHIHGPDKDPKGLDFNVIEKNFMDEAHDGELLFKDQSLKFKTYDVDLAECSICSFAISLSVTSYTSRYLFDNYTLIVSEYLDSKRLHQTLSESQDEIRRLAKLPEEDFGRVLPVYIFDLEVNTILLLDRYHQSVAFKDMVIAVRTKNTQTVSDYSCNGRHVFTQTRELERPLVGSILQSMWGVSPTHLVWSPQHNSTLVDYTWSVGHTPFGPFSELSSLSFIQKDATRRNVLLTSLNYTITSALDVLESIAAHGGERKLLPHNELPEFIQRWNLFKYKLDKVVSSLSHLDFEMALYYLRSSDHDLYAIHSIVYHASQDLEASLVCFEDPPFPWASFSMSIGIFFVLLYAYLQRDKLFSNKRKQF